LVLITLVLGGSSVARRVAAQTKEDTIARGHLGSLRPGTPVRLATRSQSILYGRLLGATTDQITLDPTSRAGAPGPVQVKLVDISSAEYLAGEHRLRGALIGGVLGAATGLLVGNLAGDL